MKSQYNTSESGRYLSDRTALISYSMEPLCRTVWLFTLQITLPNYTACCERQINASEV